MADDRKIHWHSENQKGNNYSITLETLTNLHVRYHSMVKYTQNKIHEIWSIAYLGLAEDGINS